MSHFSDMTQKIRQLYALSSELEAMFPGRRFTPDGHMVGSIGEVIAAEEYGLSLFKPSHPVHDAEAPDGRLVQVKATQGDKVAISECPENLIVLKIARDGSFSEVYNGPGIPAWEACGKLQKTGQRHISVSKLRALSSEVSSRDKILRLGAITEFCREWLPRLGDHPVPLASFTKAAYESGVVLGDYSLQVEGLDKGELDSAEAPFVSNLSNMQLLGAIAWHIRRDYWSGDDGTLERSISSGALPRLMSAWVDAMSAGGNGGAGRYR